jgi:hypothetical protein
VAQAPYDLTIGETVAGYRVERLIGRGGSATVYEARRATRDRPELDQPVAFKVIHEHDASGVGKLDHPNVVRLLDFGYTERDWPFIVFELLRGMSLKAAIRQRGPFDPPTTARVTLELLAGLAAAHDVGIVHRDIKPANVFLHRNDQGEVVRVLDLGLAKALYGDGVEVQTLTGTGYRLGTPRYMAPEMARGEGVGAAGDLYAVALLMAEMIAGRPVLRAQSQVELLLAHSSQQPLPLDEVIVQSAFHAVIARGLAKDLQVRYRNAMQMRADVEAALMLYQRLPQLARAQAEFAPDLAPTMVYGGAAGAEARVADLAAEDGLGSTLELSDGATPTLSMDDPLAPEAATERLELPPEGLTPAQAPLAATLVEAAPPPTPWAGSPAAERGGRRWGLLLVLSLLVAALAVAGYYLVR